MTTNNQNIGIVLSASRMTDMPKFYPNELIEEVEKLHDSHMPVSKKQQNHRELCGCTDSIDIGGWPPKKCYTGCQYCYARSSY
jgi:hypothetical protein